MANRVIERGIKEQAPALRAEGLSISAAARRLGISRQTVRRVLAAAVVLTSGAAPHAMAASACRPSTERPAWVAAPGDGVLLSTTAEGMTGLVSAWLPSHHPPPRHRRLSAGRLARARARGAGARALRLPRLRDGPAHPLRRRRPVRRHDRPLQEPRLTVPTPSPVTLTAAIETVATLHRARSVATSAYALRVSKATLQERVARIRGLATSFATWDAQMTPTSRLSLVQPEPSPAPEPEAAPVPANDEPTTASKAEPYRLGASPADREVVRLRDEVRCLRESLEDSHRAALDEGEVRRMLGVLSEPTDHPPSWVAARPQKHAARTPETVCTMWADWHLGEMVDREQTAGVNEYSVAIARERFRRVVQSSIEVAEQHGPGARSTPFAGAVVNVVGDLVSGGLHPELVKTDVESLLQSILSARDLLVAGLTRMPDEFGSVYAPAVAGNHGRTTRKPEYKGYVFTNADWLIYELTRRHFDATGDKRVRIDTRRSNDVYYRIHHDRYMLTHGDMLGVKGGDGIIGALGPIARGEIKFRGAAMSAGQEYDTLMMGHWHQQLWLPRAVVSNTLKGYDEYARLSLRAPISKPSQPLWFHHPRRGVTSKWDIQADEAAARPAAEWVSWSGAAA